MQNQSQIGQFKLVRTFLIVIFGFLEVLVITLLTPLLILQIKRGLQLSDLLLFSLPLIPLLVLALIWKIISYAQDTAEGNQTSKQSEKRLMRIGQITYLIGMIISGGFLLVLGGSLLTLYLAHQSPSYHGILLLLFFVTVFLSSYLKWQKARNNQGE